MEIASREQLFGKRLVHKLLLPIAIAVLAYAMLLFYGDWRAIGQALRTMRGQSLFAAVLLALASFVLRGLRWHYYLHVRRIGVPLVVSMLVFVAGLGMSITPGKVGELLKAMLLKERHDVPIAESAPIVIAERVMDLTALLSLGTIGLFWSRGTWPALALGAACFVGAFVVGRSGRVAHWGIALACKLRPIARFRDKLEAAHASLHDLWAAPSFLLAASLSLLAWALQASLIIVLANGLHAELSYPQALVASSAPLLAGTLALLPGGLGLTEATMTGTLQALAGLSATSAAGITITVRVCSFWLATVLGLGTLAFWFKAPAFTSQPPE